MNFYKSSNATTITRLFKHVKIEYILKIYRLGRIKQFIFYNMPHKIIQMVGINDIVLFLLYQNSQFNYIFLPLPYNDAVIFHH